MASQAGEEGEFTILVTGFGPFREQYPVNPSWEIARSLPAYLPPLRAEGGGGGSPPLDMPAVRILVHPEPIHVGYRAVRSLVPSFWAGAYAGRRVDAAVHMGMAGARPVYLLERLAHRTGYASADADGEMLGDVDGDGDGDGDGGGGGDGCAWDGLPDELESACDVAGVYLRWKELCSPDMDVRVSEDPGRYLCDFIYYSSLSTLRRQDRPGKVCFLHVPADASDEAVGRGGEVALNLVRAIAEIEVAERRRAAALRLSFLGEE